VSRRGARRGANAIEFALTIPVFVAISLGILDGSWLLWQHIIALDAAQEGCRAGAIMNPGVHGENMAAVEAEAKEKTSSRMNALGFGCVTTPLTDPPCSITIRSDDASGVDNLVCDVVYDSRPLVGVIPGMVLNSRVSRRMEYQE
jgi:Flp pilus assembly protein TadG